MDAVETKFRELAHQRHSDRGGDDDRMRELIEARKSAKEEIEGVAATA
jgi:hypothetical protein